ncbi:MAG: YbhB/YbcL family Raf kinase inhibitor-like protein [Bdellovibrionota bacterium]
MAFTLTSPIFYDGQELPGRYTALGADVSPSLEWSDAPGNTRSFALLCEDPDVPFPDVMTHWLIYNVDSTISLLPEGLPAVAHIDYPVLCDQGVNSFGTLGYRGPEPPPGHGNHRYRFKLYALNAELALRAGASRAELLSAMQGHILDATQIVGTFRRDIKEDFAA